MPRIYCRIQKRHNKQGVSFKISEVKNIIFKYNFENILYHPISTLIYLLPLNFQKYGSCGFSITYINKYKKIMGWTCNFKFLL